MHDLYLLNYDIISERICENIIEGYYDDYDLRTIYNEPITSETQKDEVENFIKDDENGQTFLHENYHSELDFHLDDLNDLLPIYFEWIFGKEPKLLGLYDNRIILNPIIDSFKCILEELDDYCYDEIKIIGETGEELTIFLNSSYNGNSNIIKFINLDLKINQGYSIGDIVEIINDYYDYDEDIIYEFQSWFLESYLKENGYFNSLTRYISNYILDINEEWYKRFLSYSTKFSRPDHKVIYDLFNVSCIYLKNTNEYEFEDIYGVDKDEIINDDLPLVERFKDAFNLYRKLANDFYERFENEIDTYHWYSNDNRNCIMSSDDIYDMFSSELIERGRY